MTTLNYKASFHDRSLMPVLWEEVRGHWETYLTYTFQNFFHPFVGELIAKLNKESLPGMLDATWQDSLKQDFFNSLYNPTNDNLVQVKSFPKEIDVSPHGPYANYNWELFFHIPLMIAVHLSKTQRFAEAQRWFHYIFDPTSNDQIEPPTRFWKFLSFRKPDGMKRIEDIVRILSTPRSELSSEEQSLQDEVLNGYDAIRNKPFQPHAVARTRHLAYQYCVVMKYLDNLIAWGDHLFQQDTLESINEATQIYVLAANILGARPQRIPPHGKIKPKSFAQLKAEGLGPIGDALVDLEGQFPFNLTIPNSSPGGGGDSNPLFGIGRTLYFCIPQNDKLLSYWDTVADRLFKIRHCMNIAGIVRPLALFDPPIDPGMLVKAAAAGIDIGSVVSGLNQPIGPVRSLFLIQKALELCAEVRALGNALLSALEKGDAEHLALARQRHEIKIAQMQREVRFLQWKQAQEATTALLKTRAVTLERYKYYMRLLGKTPDHNLTPEELALDRRELTEENFDEAYNALVEQYDKLIQEQNYAQLKLEGADSPASQAGAQGQGSLGLTKSESDELSHLVTARDVGLTASIFNSLASAFAPVPDADVDIHYWGIGGKVKLNVGTALVATARIAGDIFSIAAAWERDQASITSRTASYERRVDEWTLQVNLATHELRQIGRQVISSLIAEQIARHEYEMVKKQIEHAQEVDRFLHDKFTNEELYLWMQGEISRLYYEYYRFAFDMARRAEQTMKQELMRPELDGQDFVKFNYWDGGRKGLLAGEALYLDVKRMEMAYHEQNRREYELTKHVSLLQVDPLALIQLRATGRCTVRLPEMLFDMDGPGHYFRRIKSVAVSLPCVTGPYVGVNCKLTLLKSSIRTTLILRDGEYARQGAEDDRFSDYFGSLESIVTSSGQNDSGLFETNLRDERYLPFENSGVISEWQLELPANPGKGEPTQFDYDTISDVILHLRYTAREGGTLLRNAAMKQIDELIKAGEAAGSIRLFSVRHEFPAEWYRFKTQTPPQGQRHELALTLKPEHYPFWAQVRLSSVSRVDLLVRYEQKPPASIEVADMADTSDDGTTKKDTLVKDASLGNLLVGKLTNIPLPEQPVGSLTLYFDDAKLSDLWIAVTWSG